MLTQFGHQFLHHGEIIAGFKTVGADERFNAHFVQRIFQLAEPIGGIDVDLDDAHYRRGELCDDPFGAIGRPHSDAVTWPQPQRGQSQREIMRGIPQCRPTEMEALMA